MIGECGNAAAFAVGRFLRGGLSDEERAAARAVGHFLFQGGRWIGLVPDPDPPADLWAEDGEYVWIRADLASTPERAKRIAFVGRDRSTGVTLPETILGGERFGYANLNVTSEPLALRPGRPDEWGWSGGGADTWWRCDQDHPQAVSYWQVST